jgi:hypothetical protein
MNDKKNKRNIQHPLFGISPINWIKLLDKNGGVDKKYLDRAAFITISSIFSTPSRMVFKLKYKSKIENLKIKHSPVIIIGHWRSGTTFLHELLSQDSQFCYVSLWHTMLPDSFPLFEPAKKFLSNFLPKTRPMDNIEVDIDGPYEEEAGIAVLSPWSFFHGLHFPKNAEEQYIKSIHYQGLSEQEKNQWSKMYRNFMKTVIFINQGKRLLLKDPANTARIPTLLEIFPDAKFIHLYRNPYKVYLSTIKMRNKVLDKLALQDGNKEDIEKQVIENYKRLMNGYFEQKKLIPKNNLIELRYEDLVKNPVEQVKLIYKSLNLKDLNSALPEMNKYLERKKDYKTNVYKIDDKIINHVKDNWSFTINKWKYNSPNE